MMFAVFQLNKRTTNNFLFGPRAYKFTFYFGPTMAVQNGILKDSNFCRWRFS